jgi:hypothetical protein
MPLVPVLFRYCPGVKRDAFTAVTITGSWDAAEAPSAGAWTSVETTMGVDEHGLEELGRRIATNRANEARAGVHR